MGKFLDSVPVSAIVRIRDMMYTVKDPFRLDQGDVSFDAPETFKQAVAKAMAENRTHYLPSSGIPPLRKAFAEKMRRKNGIPIGSDEEVIVTNGGTHGLFAVFQAILEPGDEVIIPDPEWPPTMAIVKQAGGVAVQVPLREDLGWRWDIADVEKAITPKTRVLYLNSPNNPTGGVLTRQDLEQLAAIARDRNLLVVSDEAYEDVVYKGEHISIASLPGMYDRTIPVYTMSKSYAITGVRVGYFAMKDPALRDRAAKVVLYSTTNVSSIAQYGAVGAMEGSQQCIADFKQELLFRRDMFFKGLQEAAPGVFSGNPPDGAFYAF
ncbi:MAG TPA: pyridoxal phosphate-dependent aminotransferase, partial [Vicinamibacterales bacterium]|nr:pyridoxal phosphate-dependent aminotransferase [Vicinamibacterales bacterium]